MRRLPVAALGSAALFLFLPVLIGGESFFGRDVAPFFYPMKHFLAESLSAGRFPLWNPWTAGGTPFFATLQPGVLYPGSIPLLLAPFPHSADWLVILHFLLAGAGWVVLLRYQGRSMAAATFGALAFVMGGYFLSIANFLNNLQTLAWAPWLFLAWGRFLVDGSAGRLATFTVLCAIAFLGGEPQLLVLTLALAFALGLVSSGPSIAARRQLLSFAGAGVLAAALVGVQLLPFIEYLGQSVRTMPLDLDFTSSRSMDVSGLAHLAVPPAIEAGPFNFTTQYLAARGVPWILSAYLGAIVIAFWIRGLVAVDRRTRVFWGSLAVAGVILALGSHSLVYRALFDVLPPFRAFRYPEKFLLLLAVGVPFLASTGFDRWRSEPEEGKALGRLLLTMSAGYAAVAGVLAIWPRALDVMCPGSAESPLLCADTATAAGLYVNRLVIVFIVLALGWLVVRLRRGGMLPLEPACWALLALTVFDLGLAHRSVNPSVESSIYTTAPWAATVLSRNWDRPDETRFRGTPLAAPMGNTVQVRGARELSNMYLDLQTMGPNAGQLFGFLQQDGLQGVELQSVAMTHDAAINEWASDPVRFLRAMNVRYYADATSQAEGLVGLSLVAQHPELPSRLFEVPDPLPRAFIAAGWSPADGPGAALQSLLTSEEPLDRIVHLEQEPATVPARPSASGQQGSITAATWGANRVRLFARAESPSLLVLLDRWYPGWKVTVNGSEARILRANGVFRAVEIPAGESDVEFRYAPESVKIGGAISGVGLVGLILLLGFSRRKANG